MMLAYKNYKFKVKIFFLNAIAVTQKSTIY